MTGALRRLFLENLSLKLTALVLSFTIFLVVRAQSDTVSVVDIPVVVHVPEGHVLANAPEAKVQVTLRGKWSRLRELDIDSIGPINVTPPRKTGRNHIALQPGMLRLPAGLTVDEFDPISITVELEPFIQRRVPISTRDSVEGDLPTGFFLGQISVKPREAVISGPRSVVEQAKKVSIEPASLKGRRAAFRESALLISGHEDIDVIDPQKVTLTVEIISQSERRVLRRVPIKVIELARPHKISPERTDVVLLGPREALDRVNEKNVFVVVDASEEEDSPARSVQYQLVLDDIQNLPPDVTVNEAQLPSVLIHLEVPEPVAVADPGEDTTPTPEHSSGASSDALHPWFPGLPLPPSVKAAPEKGGDGVERDTSPDPEGDERGIAPNENAPP